MAELRWTVTLEDGQSFSGSVPAMGVTRICCDIPAGTLGAVTAVVPVSIADDEKIFMNGYQTWTYCPEYGRTDRIRGVRRIPGPLVKFFSLDRYGDYHFVDYPYRAGITHGFSWCYFRRGGSYRLAASLDETPGYTIFSYDANTGLLTIRRDCAGVRWPGGTFHAFDLYFAVGPEAHVFDCWFSAMGVKPRTNKPLAGYSSWYNRYDDITEETVMADLAGCRGLLAPGDLFQVDDGWEPAVGDWLVPDGEKFPGGMRAVADAAHEAGFMAGLWLAPFVCEKDSAIFKSHPDWLLRIDGKPWKCGCNWSGFYALDIDKPPVREYLEKVFRRVLDEWGFDLVKLDFLYGAAPFGTDSESRAGRMIRAMELLRAWCGNKLILGCGVPVMPAFGRVDYCRVGCDVGLDWDDKPIMRIIHRERVSTRQSIGNTIFRRQLDGRAWGSDPDVFFLRDENVRLTPDEKKKLAEVNALFGSVLLTSDDPAGYSAEARQEYARLLALRGAGDVTVEADGPLSVCYTLDGARHRIEI